MSALISLLFAFALTHISVSADSHSFGKCPHIDPQPDFSMNKFLGVWYAIQRTSTDSPCLMYNITEKEGHPGYYLLTETYPSSKLANWVGLGHQHKVTGELGVENEKTPALMNLHVPYEIGSSKFTVFMTDYDNCAAIFSCKTYPLTFSRLRKWSAQILSRTPSLDIEYIEKIRNRLSAYNINPFSLSVINQYHCKDSGKKGVILQVASDAVDDVKNTVRKLAKDVLDLKPKIQQKVDSVKKTLEDVREKVEETVQSSKDTLKVNIEEKSIIQNSLDQPEVFELYDNRDNFVDGKKVPDGHGPSPYWNPSDNDKIQPTQLP